jgi:hypothetical protein
MDPMPYPKAEKHNILETLGYVGMDIHGIITYV